MVLDTLVVDAVELGKSGVRTDQARVSEESPYLLQGHGKRLFALVGFDLSGINSIPVLELGVVSQENVLNLFEAVFWVLFEFDEIGDVDKLLERILFDFLLGPGGSESALSGSTSKSAASSG